jgi:chlorinating enzyme
MRLDESTPLTTAEQDRFVQVGYHFPVRVLDATEASRYHQRFMDYRNRNSQRLQGMSSKEQYQVFSDMHFVVRWVYDLAVHPRVLDAVQSILGNNLIVWASNWFAKMPGEKTFVSWHQDGKYWNLFPDKIVTAWVALSPSTTANGCLRVVPGTHRQRAMPHRETYNPDNALSRGQDVAVAVDESRAVDLELQTGEMSLHHLWIVHGSRPNTSPDTPRIGLAIRYVSTEVRQDSPTKPLGILVRGRDDFGHFELRSPPTRDALPAGDPEHLAIIERIRASVMTADARTSR